MGYQREPKSWRMGMSRKVLMPSFSKNRKIRATMRIVDTPAT
jgi:hypothetical protein